MIARIYVAGQQLCAVSVRARKQQRGDSHYVCGQTGGNEFLNGFRRRHQDFAAQMTAFFRRR